MSTDKKSDEKSKLSSKQFVLVVIVLGSIAIALATYLVDDLFKTHQLPYPENLHTLVIEVGIGVIITLLIYTFSTQQQRRLESLVTEIKKFEEMQQKIIQEQEDAKMKRKDTALGRIETILTQLWVETGYHEALLSKYYHRGLPEDWNEGDISEHEATREWITMIKKQTFQLADDLRNWTMTSYDLLDSDLLYALQCITAIASKEFYFDTDKSDFDLMECAANIDWLEKILVKNFHHPKDNIGTMGFHPGKTQ